MLHISFLARLNVTRYFINSVVQISVLEEQKKEAARKAEGVVQASNNQSTTWPTSKVDGSDGKFNMDKVLMERSQVTCLD